MQGGGFSFIMDAEDTGKGCGCMRAEDLAKRFKMDPHVEGGSFIELDEEDTRFPGRAPSGVIYYYLGADEFSDFHVLDSDEYWLWHAGTPLEIWMIGESGEPEIKRLGIDEQSEPCVLIRRGIVFGARHVKGERGDGTMVSCVTVPRFSYESYRILPKEEVTEKYPQAAAFFD